MTEIPSWLLWLGALGAGLTTVGIIFRLGVACARAFRKIDQLMQVIDPVITMANDFKSNGGSSLKDAIGRIDVAAAGAVDRATAAETQVTELAGVVHGVAAESKENNRLLHELKGTLTTAVAVAAPGATRQARRGDETPAAV